MMKTIYLLLMLPFMAEVAAAQNQWTWLDGSQNAFAPGNYGTQGTASPSNVPGSRIGAATWRDNQGNLWLFGGRGNGERTLNDPLNDLWKFEISSGQWIWMGGSKNGNGSGNYGEKGVSAPDNQPGARENAAYWTDKQGNFWVFGGSGKGEDQRDQGLLNDLWRYTPTSNRWTWIAGGKRVNERGEYGRRNGDDDDDDDDDDDNGDGDGDSQLRPGARTMASTWIDPQGNLWMFGGRGYAARREDGDLNDVWKFSPASNEWTWVAGERNADARSRHGNKGNFGDNNTPGGRYGSTSWTDNKGNFWLFGGRSRNNFFNDLWKFDRQSGRWAWISGTDDDNQLPEYEEKGSPDPNGHPGSRMLAVGYADENGELWLIGGTGYGGLLGSTPLNSLWKYNIENNTWTFIKGDLTLYPPVVYGTRGVPDPANQPGGTTNGSGWVDAQGNFWLFGGQSLQGQLNQLWKFSRACAAAQTGSISPKNASICKDGSQVLTATGGNSYQWQRNGENIAGATQSTFTAKQAGNYTVLVTKGQCTAPAVNAAVITEVTTPTGNITPASATLCEGSTQVLTANGGTSYEWQLNGVTIPGQTKATLTASEAGTYSVIIKNGTCTGPASNTAVIKTVPALSGSITPTSAAICNGSSQVLTATGGTSYQWLRDGSKIAETGATLTVTEPGTYSVIISDGNCSVQSSNDVVVSLGSNAGTRYADVIVSPNVPAQLSARAVGGTYEWSPAIGLDNPAIATPMVTTSSEREYLVRIDNGDGCPITDTVLVKILAEKKVFVPTAFTPNGNGTNDRLRPLGNIATINYFKVYNRWGNLVFQTTELGAGWDGRVNGALQPGDTYTWILSGNTIDGEEIKQTGKTLLIR